MVHRAPNSNGRRGWAAWAFPGPTPRLLFRTLAPSDFPAFASAWSQPAYVALLGGERPSDTESIQFMFEERRRQGQHDYMFELRDDRRLVGRGSIQNIDAERRRAEIELEIPDEGMRGMGLGSEALDALIGFARAALGLTRIEAKAFAGNPASLRLGEKAGFRPRRRSLPVPGRGAVITLVLEGPSW